MPSAIADARQFSPAAKSAPSCFECSASFYASLRRHAPRKEPSAVAATQGPLSFALCLQCLILALRDAPSVEPIALSNRPPIPTRFIPKPHPSPRTLRVNPFSPLGIRPFTVFSRRSTALFPHLPHPAGQTLGTLVKLSMFNHLKPHQRAWYSESAFGGSPRRRFPESFNLNLFSRLTSFSRK